MKLEYVYILREENGDPSLVKIGHAADPLTRSAGLKTGNHHKLIVVFTLLGGRELEKEIHGRFPELRVGTGGKEWFKLSPDLIDFLVYKTREILQDDSILISHQKNFDGPIVIPPLELGVSEPAPVSKVRGLRSVQPYGVTEATQPKNPYGNVGRKR